MTELSVGSPAPDFTLAAADGSSFTLSEQRGKPVVLFFYPQDDTEGCTLENQEFSALAGAFAERGAVLAGISPDSIASHCRFCDKYRLTAPLLSDPDRVAVDAYGLWQLKKLWGVEYMGLVRTTFVIDRDGRVAAILKATRIRNHAQKVLQVLDELLSKAP